MLIITSATYILTWRVKTLVKKKQGFLYSIIVLIISQCVIKVAGLIYKLYLVNKEGFGDSGNAIYASAFQIYAIALAITSIGVPNAISKLISAKVARGDNKGAYRTFKISFVLFGILGFIGSSVLFINAHVIACNYLGIPEAEISLMALAPSIFFVTLEAVLKGYFNGREKISVTANSQSIEQIFKTIVTIISVEIFGILSKKNTVTMVGTAALATTLATAVSFGYLYICYIKSKKEIWKEVVTSSEQKQERIRTIIKTIFWVAMPISISSLLSAMNRTIDAFTIVKGMSNYIELEQAKIQYGILTGKVETLISLPFSFNMAFAITLIPAISAAVERGSYKDAKSKIKFSMLASFVIGIISSVFLYLFADLLLKILFPKASAGANMLKLSSWSIIFVVMTQTITGVMQGLGKFKTIIISMSIGCIVKLFLNIILLNIQELGIYGAIIATLTSQIVVCLINVIYLLKYINMELKTKKAYK